MTDSIPGERTTLKCLGLLANSNCPHYNWEAYRDGYHRLLSQEQITPGYAADDGVGLHFIGDPKATRQRNRLTNIISSRPQAMAYYLEKKNGKVVENPLKPQYLGK